MAILKASRIIVLKSEGYEDLKLETEPSGLEDLLVNIHRSRQYFGLFRQVKTGLRWVEEGLEYVQRIYEAEGTEHVINLGIYEYEPPPVDKFKIAYVFELDLSTYKYEENFVSCDINEASFTSKLKNRDDIKVNLSKQESIDGVALPFNATKPIYLHQRAILQTSTLVLNEGTKRVDDYDSPIDSRKGFSLPINKGAADLQNITDQTQPQQDTVGSIFWNPLEDAVPGTLRTVRITGSISAYVDSGVTDTQDKLWQIAIRRFPDNTFTSITSDTILWQWQGQLENAPPIDFTFDASLFNVTTEEVLSLVFTENTQSFAGGFQVVFTGIDCLIEVLDNFDSTIAQGYLLHEAAQRITEVITDAPGAFKSNLLGRTDLGYNEDGRASLQSLHSGKQIRQFPSTHPSLSLKDFFHSINCMHNIGIGIEYNELGQPYLVLEEKQHFFSGQVIGTLHQVSKLEKDVAREWIYNDIRIGYNKSEYEEVQGLEEYNNKFDWATYIGKIKNELSLVSKIRADGYGIEFARRKSYFNFPTEDTKYDNDNFTVVVRKAGLRLESAKDEEYDIVENIFSPETAYNLDLSPGRMLRRHGNVIRAGLEKQITKPIKFQFAEQKSNMVSQRTGEASIDENADIDASTLDTGLWIPELYSFDSELDAQLLKTIMRNPYGIIKFSAATKEGTERYYYGWIIDVEGNDDTNEATWKLLRVNTQNPDLKLIDPDGDGGSIVQPPIVQQYYGYESPFDMFYIG